jgi:hypothetical protein
MINPNLLLRQVNLNFWHKQDQSVSSQAFQPTPKDNNRLSVSDSNMITAEESWKKFTEMGYNSVGVLAVSCLECTQCDLPVHPDPLENQPEHTVIDFSGKQTKKSKKDAAKILRDYAVTRGWQFKPEN